MKKLFLTLFAATMSLVAMAQNDIWYWKNGIPVEVAAVDSITFAEPQGEVHKCVNLGLSVKWATCNVGAEKPEEYGDYFAWGETAPKGVYSWSTYKFTTDGGKNFTKYGGSNNTILDAEDDAAAANWGGVWRMPTKEEVEELLNNCTWEWQAARNTTFDGVEGYKVTSKKDGYTDKYIFLPAAGYRGGSGLLNAGFFGYYWSATVDGTGVNASGDAWYAFAYDLYLESGYRRHSDHRYLGQTVRPVCP